MKKTFEDEPKKGAPAYMNTYGDMMTLLLTFFVLLFSMSTVDTQKFRGLIDSFNGSTGLLVGGDTIKEESNMLGNGLNQFPTDRGNKSKQEDIISDNNSLKAVKEDLEKFIETENLKEKVAIEKSGDEIILRFDDILLFDTGKADIKPGAVPILNTLGNKIKDYLDQGFRIRLEGHTDNVPIKTVQFPSNWELSAARAIAVAKFFINEMDMPSSKISAEGFGEYNPIGDNDTSEGRSINRRVEVRLSKDAKSKN